MAADNTTNATNTQQGQLCTPEQMAAMQNQQGQLCTPEQMAVMQNQQGQLCTPQQLAAMQGQQGQLCTPQQMAAMQGQQGQLCTPQQMAAMQNQLCTPQAMMQLVSQFSMFMPQAPGFAGGAPQAGPDVYAIEKPVENPNVIAIEEPHVGKPTKSPEEALTIVFTGIFPEGYTADENLFEKGLDSFKIMQIVTRASENGYRIKMQDIFKNPTFNGIASKMEAGE